MNEKLMAEMAKILEYLRVSVEQGGEFVKEQAPLVVQEAIAYGRAIETWWMLVHFTLLIVGLFAVRNWKGIKLQEYDPLPVKGHGYIFFTTLVRTVMGALGFVGILVKADNLFKAWFAPRIYLLEWVAELIRTASGGSR